MVSMKKAIIAGIVTVYFVCAAYFLLALVISSGLAGLSAVIFGHTADIKGVFSQDFLALLFGPTVILIGQTHGGYRDQKK
jgi:hypothetical protein